MAADSKASGVRGEDDRGDEYKLSSGIGVSEIITLETLGLRFFQ